MAGRLIERDAELREIAGLLARARAGEGGVLVLEGPMGIGKTALLWAAGALAGGLRVLRGIGGELEHELSFGLVREIFAPVVRQSSADERERWFAGPARPAEAVLGDGFGAPADPASVVFGLYWLLAAISEREPVLLVADDLQWCDAASLRWLVYLARRVEGLPVAVLLASRPPDSTEPGLAGLLASASGVAVRRPRELSLDATRELVTAAWHTAPADELVEACRRTTGGNPWLLHELLEAAREQGLDRDAADAAGIEALGGERLRSAVLGRLARMDEPAGRLARAVAVLGDGCDLRLAGEFAGLEPEAAAAALDALAAAGVLARERWLAFAHPLLRAAVHEHLPAPVRAAEHARAAAFLHAAGSHLDTVAAQLLVAEPIGAAWARATLAAAAQAALARGAPDSAVAFLRRALAERPPVSERGELLCALGNALARRGDPAACEVLEQALELTRDAEVRVGIVEAAVDPLTAAGRAADARALLRAVLAETDDLDAVTRLSARLAMNRALSGGLDDEDVIAALRARADRLDPGSSTDRYAAGALALVGAVIDGSAAEVRALALRAVGRSAEHVADARDGRPLHMALVALALAGDPPLALEGSERAIAVSRARGSLLGQGLGLSWRALLHVLAGNVTDAENDGRAALAVFADTGLHGIEPGPIVAIAWALTERGAAEEAQAALNGLGDPPGWLGAGLRCARARVLIARHRHRDALTELAPLCEPGPGAWRSSEALPWRSLAATAHLGVGARARARALADEEVAGAERFGSSLDLGRALRVRGLAEGGAVGLASLEAAIAALRAGGATLELGRALVDRGAALRRARRRAEARPPLREGMELAHGSGATALVERARDELRAAGARPRNVMRSGVDALTPSERRVAALAARGLTNVEVAQALFVTTRTVETHLSAAYRKLGIASRTALPDGL